MKGAYILCGGKRIAVEGFFYEPTIRKLEQRNASYDDEILVPLHLLIKAWAMRKMRFELRTIHNLVWALHYGLTT